jgi:hypothetical protein
MVPSRLNREKVDTLIDHLWQKGYLTLSRKYGKYLPAPPQIGGYEVDAVAKYKKKIALGLTVANEELNDPRFISKLDFLVNYNTRFSQNRVTIFLGVPNELIVKASMLISSMGAETQHRVKIVPLPDTLRR